MMINAIGIETDIATVYPIHYVGISCGDFIASINLKSAVRRKREKENSYEMMYQILKPLATISSLYGIILDKLQGDSLHA